jgi:hypothetical protein
MGDGLTDADQQFCTAAAHAFAALFSQKHFPELYGNFFRIVGDDCEIWELLFKNIFTGEKAVYIVYSVKPVYAMNSVDVRHCLVQFDTEDTSSVTNAQKEAAQKEAKALLDEWLAGDKTEESFAALVKDKTDDTASKETGGLYEGIRTSDNYVAAFEEWSFDDSRKAGDYGIVETEYGYHIMYFVSDNTDDLDWKETIRTSIGAEDLETYETELLKEGGEYSIKKHNTWINMVSDNFCDNIRKNLAYSA